MDKPVVALSLKRKHEQLGWHEKDYQIAASEAEKKRADESDLLDRMADLKLDEPKEASLLGIPGELRNKIYRLALVQEEPIVVENHRTMPGLTRTSRALRQETRNIFLHENKFEIRIINLKPRLPRNFGLFSTGHNYWLSRVKPPMKLRYAAGPQNNWKNLKAWLKWMVGGLGPLRFGPGSLPNSSLEHKIAHKACMIVLNMPGVPWQQVDAALEEFKEATELLGFQWT